jgi:hypothetical protein
VTPREIALRQALGRAVLGAGLTVVPGVAARGWIGKDARAAGTRVVTTAMGARDLAIAVGAIRAVRTGGDARPWFAAGAFADTADLVATLRAREDLPSAGVIGVAALATGSAAVGLWLTRALSHSTP